MAFLVALVAGLLVVAESQASSMAERSNPSGFLNKFITQSRSHMKNEQSFRSTNDLDLPKVADKGEEKAVLANDNNMPMTLSAIGVGLLALVAMLGVRLQRGLQPSVIGNSPLLESHSPNLEMKSRDSKANAAAALRKVGWGQLSSQNSHSPTACYAFDASTMEGAQKPFGFWDPLGFSKNLSPEALAWFRAAELKHGRVSMLACVGFTAQSYPLTLLKDVPIAKSNLYPNLSTVDMTFGDIAAAGNPIEQFKMIPTLGLWQFAFVAGFIETYSEYQKPHYLRGGSIGRVPLIWDPVGQLIRGETITDTLSEEDRAKKRNRELANGRLAMIGAMGFSAHYMIEGSVPVVFGNY
jgi:hypothetical protein